MAIHICRACIKEGKGKNMTYAGPLSKIPKIYEVWGKERKLCNFCHGRIRRCDDERI